MRAQAVAIRVAAVLLTVLAGACGGPPSGADGARADGELSGEVVVFAAASLTDALADIADAFEEAHPEVTVTLNLAGSQRLAAQVLEGAPADVLATADAERMAAVSAEGLVDGEPRTLARNRLAIAVEPGNPRGVGGLADLDDPGLLVVLAAEDVPAGGYAREALGAAGVDVAPASLERDVRGALSKVELGEADAAIVYASDIAAAGEAVEGVGIADEHNVEADLPIAALRTGANPEAGRAFVELALGPQGQAALADHGLEAP